MKFKRILTSGLLAGAMLALPMTAPAFAEPAYSANSNYVERVNWWHHDYDDHDGYRNRGYYGNGTTETGTTDIGTTVTEIGTGTVMVDADMVDMAPAQMLNGSRTRRGEIAGLAILRLPAT